MSERIVEHEDLRDGDLLAVLEGAAAPALAAHVAGCPRCQAELRSLSAADALLATVLTRADCPAAEGLLGYAAGMLGQPASREIAAHLVGCAECQAELALLIEPPAPAPLGRLARAGVRMLRAALKPAPRLDQALRGAAASRLVYAVGDYQLLIVVEPSAPGGRAQIEGQLLGAEAALASGDATAELIGTGAAAQVGPLDELGFFAFDAVPAGSYALALNLADAQILVEQIEVKMDGRR